MDILNRGSQSEFGKRHQFSKLSSVEQFQNTVPLSTWEDYAPAVKHIAEGERNLLFTEDTVQFLQTSGTNGQNKWIPLNQTAVSINSLVTCLRSYFRRRAVYQSPFFDKENSVGKGRVFLFSSPAHIGHSPCGIPIGYASGQTAKHTPDALKKMHISPDSSGAKNSTEQDALALYHALSCTDVVAAVGNNPRRFLALLQRAQKNAPAWIESLKNGQAPGLPEFSPLLAMAPHRARELELLHQEGAFWPKRYWPHMNLACFWLAGPMAPAIAELRPLLPKNTVLFDAGYGASEQKINVPLEAGTAFAPPALFAAFFEFLPQEGGAPVLLDELQDGGVYELVLTNYAGLYRYRLGDWIQVCQKTEKTPNIAFYGRVSECANLSGESVEAALLLQAALNACSELSVSLSGFALWPDAKTGRYHCYIELHKEETLPSFWPTVFDEHLQSLAAGYKRRRLDGSLAQPSATQMPSGWENARLSACQGAQTKTPTILKKPFPSNF